MIRCPEMISLSLSELGARDDLGAATPLMSEMKLSGICKLEESVAA
jgi:hypothetical protein